jgi:hypothetical protein
MKLKQYLKEAQYNIYQAITRITHSEDTTVQELGNRLRAVEGVVTVVQVDHDYDSKTAIMKIKLLSLRGAKEAYADFKSEGLRTIPELEKIEVAVNTITKID